LKCHSLFNNVILREHTVWAVTYYFFSITFFNEIIDHHFFLSSSQSIFFVPLISNSLFLHYLDSSIFFLCMPLSLSLSFSLFFHIPISIYLPHFFLFSYFSLLLCLLVFPSLFLYLSLLFKLLSFVSLSHSRTHTHTHALSFYHTVPSFLCMSVFSLRSMYLFILLSPTLFPGSLSTTTNGVLFNLPHFVTSSPFFRLLGDSKSKFRPHGSILKNQFEISFKNWGCKVKERISFWISVLLSCQPKAWSNRNLNRNILTVLL